MVVFDTNYFTIILFFSITVYKLEQYQTLKIKCEKKKNTYKHTHRKEKCQ